MSEPTTERELRLAFPAIPWRTPVRVTLPGATGLACRLCIALHGLSSSDVERLFADDEAWLAHMDEAHPWGLDGPH